MPQVKALSPARWCPPSDALVVAALLTNCPDVPTTPSLRLITLLELLSELRKTHSFTRLLIYYKGYQMVQMNKEVKRYTGQSPYQRSFCPHGVWDPAQGTRKHSGSPRSRLPEPSPSGFLWMLHCVDAIA